MAANVQTVTDAAGNVYQLTPVLQAAQAVESAARTDAQTRSGVNTALVGAAAFVAARAVEPTTQFGAVGAALAAQPMADHAALALAAGLAGDYVACASNALPVLLGMFGCLAAILTPEKKGMTDDQIKTAVASLSHQQLIGLLDQSVTVACVAGGSGGGDGSASNHGAVAAG